MIGEIRDVADGAPLALVIGRDDADFGSLGGRRAGRRDLRHGRRLHRARLPDRRPAPAAALPLAAPRRPPPARLDGARARVPGREPRRQRARASTPPRPSSRSSTGATAIAEPAPERPRRGPGGPGSPTSAPRSSGSRWSGRRWRRIRAGAGSSTGPRSRASWSRSASSRCCSASAAIVSPRTCSPTTRARAARSRRDQPGRRRGGGPQRHLDQRARRARSPPTSRPAATTVGAITNTAPGVEKTEVFYAKHQKPRGAEGRPRPRGERRSSRWSASCATSPAAPTWS